MLTDEEITQIIQDAESNPPSDDWKFFTDQDDIIFLQKQIKQNGRINIEEI